MKTEFERAYVTAHGNLAVLTLNHPESLNAASVSMVHGAAQAISFIEKRTTDFARSSSPAKGAASALALTFPKQRSRVAQRRHPRAMHWRQHITPFCGVSAIVAFRS